MADHQCEEVPVVRYTWPGRDESYACIKHGLQIKGLAEALGFPLQLIPLSADKQAELACSQLVKEGS